MREQYQAVVNLLTDLIFLIWELFRKQREMKVPKYNGPYGLA